MPAISVSNRTATTATINGSGFLGLGGGATEAAIRLNAIDILTAVTDGSLLNSSWSVVINVSSAGGNYTFTTFTIGKGGAISIVETASFSVSAFLETSAKVKRVSITSLSKSGSSLKLRSPSRKNFPTI
jgi:hypothetical protein